MDISPSIECSSLNVDLVFKGLSLFPMIFSFGCENLYLKVFLDWVTPCEPSWASLEFASSRWASEVGLASGPPTYGYPASECLIASEPPASEVTSNT